VKNWLVIMLVLMVGLAKASSAQDSLTKEATGQGTPLVYNREILTINSNVEVPNPAYQTEISKKPSPPTPLPEGEGSLHLKPSPNGRGSLGQDEKSDAIPKTFTQIREHVFYITAESSDAMSKSWFINSTNIKGNKGVLYLLDEPAIPTISPSTSLQANDILFIGSYGTIKAIAKNIKPSELAEPMELDIPVKGILYLEAGITDKLGIKSPDMVDYSAFPKQPNLTK
jgi:uncharacterized membrane protein (UPF0127 family)